MNGFLFNSFCRIHKYLLGRFNPKSSNTQVQLTYKIGCICSYLDIQYPILFHILNLRTATVGAVVVGFFFVCSLILNYKKFYLLGRLVLFFSVLFCLIFYSILLGQNSGAHLILFGLTVFPLLIFDATKIKTVIGLSLLPLFTFVVLTVVDYPALVGVLDPEVLKTTYISGGVTGFIFILFQVITYRRMAHTFAISLEEKNKTLEKAYESLKASKEMTESLSRQLEMEELSRQSAYATLTRGIAHEIKNPLQILSGQCELVIDDLENKERIKKFAEVMLRNIKRLKKLIHSMLEYGASSGNDKEVFCINDVVEDIAELSGHKCKENGIALHVESDELFNVLGNKVFIYQALLNLVVNAIQYTPRRGSITLRCARKDYIDKENTQRQGVEIAVADTGVGISEENMKQIFVPYFTSKAQPENTGLGLSMAFKTIAENEGRLEVESKEGKGTTFFVYLPLV